MGEEISDGRENGECSMPRGQMESNQIRVSFPRKTPTWLVRVLPKINSSFLEGGREWGNSS